MRSLDAPSGDYRALLDRIVPPDHVVAPRRQELIDAARGYRAAGAGLHAAPSVATTTTEADALRALYKQHRGGELWPIIRAAQTHWTDHEGCPYCCHLSEGDTLDHFFEKKAPPAPRPEYSLLPLNLIPACSTCQNRRGRWVDGSETRRLIHFYLDPLETLDQVLEATVSVDPLAVSLTVNHAAGRMEDLFRAHVANLNLLHRWRKAARGYAGSRKIAIRNRAESDAVVITSMQGEADGLAALHGKNHWQPVVLRALATPEFITYCRET